MSPDEVAVSAQLAALLEVAAEKPGNVTPRHRFADMRLADFLASAAAIGPAMRAAGQQPVGETILQAIRATRRVTRVNTNLGIVLLFAPLARAALAGPTGSSLRANLEEVLAALTVEDAVHAYHAIRLAQPGGLNHVQDEDVSQRPTVDLRAAMSLAQERDSIAREYVTGYEITFDIGLPALREALSEGLPVEEATLITFLTILARVPDTLIARKVDLARAEAISERARALLVVVHAPVPEVVRHAFQTLDTELRDPHNRHNPGTTADLTAAALFVALLLDGPEQVLRVEDIP
jgi:triphosphoribosyl-dephospho-CoA synthase